jgi:hypothetical protein
MVRPGSERNVHCAPTDARNSYNVWCWSVAMVNDLGVADRKLRVRCGQLEVLLMLLRAVVATREREDHRVVTLELAE